MTYRLLGAMATLGTMLLSLAACHSSVTPSEEELLTGCPHPVRITATVASYSAPSSLRSSVEKPTSTPGVLEEETKDIATANEGRIFIASLYVLRKNWQLVKAKCYYNSFLYAQDTKGEIDDEDLKQAIKEGRVVPFDQVKGSDLTMSIDLKPGDYRFILVANSLTVLKEALQGNQDHLFFKEIPAEGNELLWDCKSRVGYGEFWKKFSFVGAAEISVPGESKQEPLTPAIALERTYARLQMRLSTANAEGWLYTDSAGYQYSPKQYQLTSAAIHASTSEGKVYPYTLMPLSYEGPTGSVSQNGYSKDHPNKMTHHTLIPKGTNFSGRYSMPNIDCSKTTGALSIAHLNEGGAIRKMIGQSVLRPADTKGQTIKEGEMVYFYLPPIYSHWGNSGGNREKVAVDLTFGPAEGAKVEPQSYRILLHNNEGPNEYYSILRNTIYDVSLVFYGKSIRAESSGVWVLPWRKIDQTIDFYPDDTGDGDKDWVRPGDKSAPKK